MKRYWEKRNITRSLSKRGFKRQEIVDLYQFIDWVLSLPEKLDKQFWEEQSNFEENQGMQYVMSVERKGHQEGHQEGEKTGGAKILTRQLQRRFGNVPTWASEKITKADLSSLETWSLQIFDAKTLDEVFADPA